MKISFKIYLRIIINYLLLSLSAKYIKAKGVYSLLLASDSISKFLFLKLSITSIHEIFSNRSYVILSETKKGLQNGRKRMNGNELQVYKSVNFNKCI